MIEQLFAPALVGLMLTEREVAGARLARTIANPAAKSAVDMAMWDALGRTLELPVTSLLGGFTDRMRVSHMLRFADPAAMVAEAEKVRDLYGIDVFRVVVSFINTSAGCGARTAGRSVSADDTSSWATVSSSSEHTSVSEGRADSEVATACAGLPTDLLSDHQFCRLTLSVTSGRLFAGALAVFAPRPAARPALAVLEFFLSPANAALPGRILLGIGNPADELVARQRGDVLPRRQRRVVAEQRRTQVGG